MERQTAVLLLLALHGACVGATAPRNLALRGRATQSDLIREPWAGEGTANNVIDGNRDPDFYHGSCTHTDEQTNPWWKVDLLDTYIITSVAITNRKDAGADWINGAQLHIGNSPTPTDNPVVGTIDSISGGSTETFSFQPGKLGRYVAVTLSGSNKVLTLCEVEVYGDPTPTENAAVEGKASQSSVSLPYFANLAIDGNQNPAFTLGSCSRTATEDTPWWRVDLLKTYKVHGVTITNTADEYPEHLSGAEIRIGNSLDQNGILNPKCATLTNSTTQSFPCDGMEGRYVTVVIPRRRESLVLCEVQVTGSALD